MLLNSPESFQASSDAIERKAKELKKAESSVAYTFSHEWVAEQKGTLQGLLSRLVCSQANFEFIAWDFLGLVLAKTP